MPYSGHESPKAHKVLQIPQKGYQTLLNCIYKFRVISMKLQYFDPHLKRRLVNPNINIVYKCMSVCVSILKPNAQILPHLSLQVNPIFLLS